MSILPIKNATDFGDYIPRPGEEYHDASSIASSVATTTKSSILFASAVEDWSEEVFTEAECYIPLCGDTFETLSWTETDAKRPSEVYGRVLQETLSNFSPEDPTEFGSCCAVADTVEDAESDEDDDCVINPLQSCRTQVFEAPCSEMISSQEAGRNLQEDGGQCIANETTLELDVVFFRDSEESCCLQCLCYGDPRCVSFNGTSDLWILCDARGPVNANNPSSTCAIQEDICLDQRDHENNQCQWIELTEDEEDSWTVLQNGSRCIPNSASGESWITMYEFVEFSFRIRQRQRGIIDAVGLRMGEDAEEIVMESEDCILGDFNRSWSDSEGFLVPSPSFVQIIEKFEDGEGTEYEEFVWAVSDSNTGMHVRMRCLRQRNDEGEFSRGRIHVEALIEPESEFLEVREDPEGFCVSSNLEQEGSTANTELVESGEGCRKNSDLGKAEEVEIVRSLCGPTVLYGNMAACLVSFCEENYFPSFSTASNCIISFGDGVEGFNLKETFCRAMTRSTAAAAGCEEVWEEEGFSAAITEFYTEATSPDLSDTSQCAESVEDLPDALGDCEAGIELQYLDSGLQWVTFKGIAQNYPPCGNLNFNINDHPEIFLNPIRWKQCSISAACLSAINTVCEQQSGFTSRMILFPGAVTTESPTLSPEESPTRVPTRPPSGSNPPTTPSPSPAGWMTGTPSTLPTEMDSFSPTTFPTAFPSEIPTIYPTDFPTLSPSVYPTAYPTFNPTQSPTTPAPTFNPTSFPTWSPSKLPTESPTLFPTRSPSVSPTYNPTGFPSATPTRNPTEIPTAAPTNFPSVSPTAKPTEKPTTSPTESPTESPTTSPTTSPSRAPSNYPTESPTESPTRSPTESPTRRPTETPTATPTRIPTESPTWSPSKFPTQYPTRNPTESPTHFPTESPTRSPTNFPTESPTHSPTHFPTESPTSSPSAGEPVIPTTVPTPFPTTWGKGEFYLDFGQKADIVTFRKSIMTERLSAREKLKFSDAGEVIFTAVYKSEQAAEREMLSADMQATLTKINTFLSNQSVFSVACEMSLKIADLDENPFPEDFGDDEDDAANSTKPKKGSDFLNLGSGWRSVSVLIVGLFALIGVVIVALQHRRSDSTALTIGGLLTNNHYDL